MKKTLVYLVLFSLLVQIGCSSSTQIPYPVDKSKSENEIRQLNYFGKRLNATIQFTNQVEVESYWLKMKEDKVYFLTEGLEDITSAGVDKIKSVRFYDGYGGCMKGGWLGLGISLFGGFIVSSIVPKGGHPEGAGYAAITFGALAMLLLTAYGLFFLGDKEFNFVQE